MITIVPTRTFQQVRPTLTEGSKFEAHNTIFAYLSSLIKIVDPNYDFQIKTAFKLAVQMVQINMNHGGLPVFKVDRKIEASLDQIGEDFFRIFTTAGIKFALEIICCHTHGPFFKTSFTKSATNLMEEVNHFHFFLPNVNPYLRRIKKNGIKSYILNVGRRQFKVFEYQLTEVAKSREARVLLGEGAGGQVHLRKNPHASDIISKRLHMPLMPMDFIFFNEMYAFVHDNEIEKYFNVPLWTSNRKQIQRRIHGIALDIQFHSFVAAARAQGVIITKEECEQMFADLRRAYRVFSRVYVHGDLHIWNLMYDLTNRCFVVVDFDFAKLRTDPNIGQNPNLFAAEGREMDKLEIIERYFFEEKSSAL